MALELTNNVEANGLEDQVEVRQLIWGLNESSNEFDGFDFNRWWWVVFLLISDFVSLSLSLSLDCLISGMVVGLIIWSVEVMAGFFSVSMGVSHLLVLCLCLFHKKIFGFGWKFLGLNGGGGGWVCVYVCLLNVSHFSVWFERKSWFSRENVDDCSRKIYEVDFLGKMLMIVLGKFMRLVGFVCVCVCFIRKFLVLGGNKKMLWWKS